MFERLKYLYGQGKLTTLHLEVAISKGWINATQKTDILNK